MDNGRTCPKCARVFQSSKGLGGHVAKGGPCVLTDEERLARRRAASIALRRKAGVKPAVNRTLAQRFWAKVDTTAGLDGCWPWTSTRIPSGYGQLSHNGTYRSATHVSLELAGRPLRPGQIACHACDNPPCVNPLHLWAGSYGDNEADKLAKRRGRWDKVPPATTMETP
jgi:hypothetical protein